MKILNIAAYKFISFDESSLVTLQSRCRQKAAELAIKGTILLSTEGINLMLAGEPRNIAPFKQFLKEETPVGELTYKESFSDNFPFLRLFVRVKLEIISMGCPEIKPAEKTAPYLSPEMLRQWYRDKKEMIVLDVRNDYEVEAGHFTTALDLNLQTFREFPDALDQLSENIKIKPIVTYCTGGIRCEKAAALMLARGFQEVYQLDGGILNYLERCGDEFYAGDCFVFDNRGVL